MLGIKSERVIHKDKSGRGQTRTPFVDQQLDGRLKKFLTEKKKQKTTPTLSQFFK